MFFINEIITNNDRLDSEGSKSSIQPFQIHCYSSLTRRSVLFDTAAKMLHWEALKCIVFKNQYINFQTNITSAVASF